MNGGKITIYGDKLVLKISCKIFTLRRFVLEMITDYKFSTTGSRDAKLMIDFMDEIGFDIHARGKSSRGRNLIKKQF